MSAVRVAIVAGESSGDALGGALIAALHARIQAQGRTIEFKGVAGPVMRAAGCEPLADAHELAVMGLIEPLKHLPRLWHLRSMLAEQLTAWKPDVFIGVDAPAFNLGLARRFKSQGIATVQYVSPQIWAWRPGRVRKIARRCDLVLCLLPFEPRFYAHHAVRAEFVGHPLADQVPLVGDRAAARATLGLRWGEPVLALLPGSRLGEVQRLSAPFIASAVELARRRPGLKLIAAMANQVVRAEFARALAAAGVSIEEAPAESGGTGGTDAAGEAGEAARPTATVAVRVLDGQARTALTAADVALVASGTATLEALLCRCPMIVAYRVSALTALLVRSLRLMRLRQFALPNLLAEETLAPEFFQEAAIPANLCPAIERMLTDTARREYLQRKFQTIHESLRANGAARAAQAVLELLDARAAGGREEGE